MKGKRAAIVGAISGLLVLASGTVGFGIGREGSRTPQVTEVAGAAGSAPQGVVAGTGVAAVGALPAQPPDAVAVAPAPGKIAMPFPGPDFPGLPPYPSQAPEADGVHAVGVAYRQTDDPKTKAGQDLVQKAFEDASRQAQELADASGVKLGKLVAVSDVTQTQPFYRACVEPLARDKIETKPSAPKVPDAADAPAILPAPVPDCSPTWYVVAWVFVRYELA